MNDVRFGSIAAPSQQAPTPYHPSGGQNSRPRQTYDFNCVQSAVRTILTAIKLTLEIFRLTFFTKLHDIGQGVV
jgi:hypothetical protein